MERTPKQESAQKVDPREENAPAAAFFRNSRPYRLTVSRIIYRDQELCERGGGLGSLALSHSFPVPDKPCGFCGRKAPQ